MSAPTIHRNATSVCRLDDLEDNLGASVLLPDGNQVALFRISDDNADDTVDAMNEPRVYAISNIDPYMGAAVMSRGIVGEYEGRPTVASPLLKQRFSLNDGASLEDDSHALPTYDVDIVNDGDHRLVMVHY
jgi:nitrite reductase (NADH) small subunit